MKPEFDTLCGILWDHLQRNDSRIHRDLVRELGEMYGVEDLRDLYLFLEAALGCELRGEFYVCPAIRDKDEPFKLLKGGKGNDRRC